MSNPISPEFFNCKVIRSHCRIENVITCGRLDKQKNHTMLINAFKLAHERYPELKLCIYGDGDDKEQLQSVINKNDASDYVFLMGRTNDAKSALEKADMFILSSDYEGMPNALIEAMTVGLPCISTDCPTGPRTLIGENERGKLVEVNDADKLAKAIIYMKENEEEAFELGQKAYYFSRDNFMPDIITEKLLQYIKKIV